MISLNSPNEKPESLVKIGYITHPRISHLTVIDMSNKLKYYPSRAEVKLGRNKSLSSVWHLVWENYETKFDINFDTSGGVYFAELCNERVIYRLETIEGLIQFIDQKLEQHFFK